MSQTSDRCRKFGAQNDADTERRIINSAANVMRTAADGTHGDSEGGKTAAGRGGDTDVAESIGDI